MISVLVPTRERSAMFYESIKSLGDNVEILAYVDIDDPQLSGYLSIVQDNLTFVIGKRFTYHKLHEYYNKLARLASGDWLMLWNDDAEMMTPNWTEFLHAPISPEVINFDKNEQNNLFPIISRQMYQAMGHFSLSPHNDSWVQDIANILSIHTYIDGVNIQHHRDIIDDSTKRETQAAYETTSPLHYSDELQRLMQIDIEKIKENL